MLVCVTGCKQKQHTAPLTHTYHEARARIQPEGGAGGGGKLLLGTQPTPTRRHLTHTYHEARARIQPEGGAGGGGKLLLGAARAPPPDTLGIWLSGVVAVEAVGPLLSVLPPGESEAGVGPAGACGRAGSGVQGAGVEPGWRVLYARIYPDWCRVICGELKVRRGRCAGGEDGCALQQVVRLPAVCKWRQRMCNCYDICTVPCCGCRSACAVRRCPPTARMLRKTSLGQPLRPLHGALVVPYGLCVARCPHAHYTAREAVGTHLGQKEGRGGQQQQGR